MVKDILAKLTKATYSLEEISKRPLPEGVDPLKLETYLSDSDFQVSILPGAHHNNNNDKYNLYSACDTKFQSAVHKARLLQEKSISILLMELHVTLLSRLVTCTHLFRYRSTVFALTIFVQRL